MEFRSPETMGKAIAILLSAMSLISLYIVFQAPGAAAFMFFLMFTMPCIIGIFAALSANTRVSIDNATGSVEKSFRVLGFKHEQHYSLANFNGVGIGIAGRGGMGASTTVYFVQLLGVENLKVSNMDADLASVRSDARKLAEYASLGLDEEPRTVFFGKRL